jgi:hypothetical protein
MEATCSSETSIDFYRTTRCYITEDNAFRNRRVTIWDSHYPLLFETLSSNAHRRTVREQYAIAVVTSCNSSFLLLPCFYVFLYHFVVIIISEKLCSRRPQEPSAPEFRKCLFSGLVYTEIGDLISTIHCS